MPHYVAGVAASLALMGKKLESFVPKSVTNGPHPALSAQTPMSPRHAIRGRARTHIAPPPARKHGAGLDRPGAFQCTILKAFELRKGYRDVFLLKEVQGYTLAEIAAILGISIDTALARLKSAHREIDNRGDSDAMEPTK